MGHLGLGIKELQGRIWRRPLSNQRDEIKIQDYAKES